MLISEINGKFLELKKRYATGYWSQRIISEMDYLLNMWEELDADAQNAVELAVCDLWDVVKAEGAITKSITEKTESRLSFLSPMIKQRRVILIAHAHIDMNWMWGYNETASVIVDTFGTMLQLMKEYPQFKFSQSQASVYRVLEEYAPDMLDEIKQRVKEGRWEVTASTWVENDKNMSSGEAMVRHILYTKSYLSKLLDIPEEELNLDFEPDTFGHSRNVPEILNKGGVKYYYHCRGYEGEYVYRWRAVNGAELLAYREPVWYNDEEANYDGLGFVPAFCRRYQIDVAMKFFGVGDHGGGPSRKQIERYQDMQNWPLLPVITFGTIKEYFRYLEQYKETFPVVDQELNYIFAGCYSSQARIKRANMIGENRLYDAEMLDVLASLEDQEIENETQFAKAWEKILFNQFHDILPGSGVIDTCQYALGEFQKAMATTQIKGKRAMRTVCDQIATDCFGEAIIDLDDCGYGAGVGFKTGNDTDYLFGAVGRTSEKNRVIVLFNTTPYERSEVVKVELWDWDVAAEDVCAIDSDQNEVSICIPDKEKNYWAHKYMEVYMNVTVPPLGYSTYLFKEKAKVLKGKDLRTLFVSGEGDPRLDHFSDTPLVMENEYIRAVITTDNMKLVSFVDLESKTEYVDEPSGVFELVMENTDMGMTAWRIGKAGLIQDLNESTMMKFKKFRRESLFDELEYDILFGNSKLEVTVMLEKNSRVLKYKVKADWRESGNREKGIPQLRFRVPMAAKADKFRCAIPDGMIDREAFEQDVPCLGMIAAIPGQDTERVLQLLASGKYGFRGYDDTLTVTLLRGSYDPDPLPDQGEHYIELGLGICDKQEKMLLKNLNCFLHPLQSVSTDTHKGCREPKGSILLSGDEIILTAVKKAEAGKGYVFRYYNPCGQQIQTELLLNIPVKRASKVSLMEKNEEPLNVQDGKIALKFTPFEVVTIKVER